MMSALKNKKLLIIGGDSFSVDIVKTAQSMGVYTIVTDWYDTKRSPAKLVADEYWNTSIEDYDSLTKQIKEHQVDGILTGFTDSYLLAYQHLCEINNFPSYGYYPVQYCSNNTSSNYAIILVLFILLVIVIGSRYTK